MALSMGADPRLTSVLRAIGLLDAAGQIDPQWFDHPIESLGRCLSDPGQRSAVLALLGDALPPEPGPWQADGSSWHPVLAANPVGNVYLTVSGTVLGLAARAKGPWTGTPGVDLAVRLPLVDADGDAVRAVAATEDGPLEVALRVTLGAGIIPEAIEVRVAVDAANGVRVRVILEQSGQPPAVLDPAHLDRGAVDAVQMLILALLGHETAVDPRIRRLVEHLPGAFGLDDAVLTPMPVTDPASIRPWLAGIAADPATLRAWFRHLAGLLGGLPWTGTTRRSPVPAPPPNRSAPPSSISAATSPWPSPSAPPGTRPRPCWSARRSACRWAAPGSPPPPPSPRCRWPATRRPVSCRRSG
ncbi:hypothetical protein Asp14428_21220 [Actinoplanes sp. NBRC 14428]|nr:hypothetical protein Asp14428_21220 [Actinoplanes sp. NBRC 14428]